MKITLARHSGFCMGVRNAILRIVHELNLSDDELYVYGPLIHNPQTIDVLHGRGMRTVSSRDGLDGRTVVIRTHGIPVEELKQLKQCAASVINLTCPRVARVQSIIKKHSGLGRHTIITGDRNHAEVTGLMSFAARGVTVISDLNEINSIPRADAYVVVSQTTFDRMLFNKIVTLVRERYDNVHVFDTICDATRYRQEDVITGILHGIDTLVVVGGKNSANTKRLAQIGRDNRIATFHVEDEQELRDNEFAESKNVLVTAGTSTPGWIINNVLEKLYSINVMKGNILFKALMNLMQFIVRTNILSAVAAFFITRIAMAYAGIPDNYIFPALSFLYIFSMYTINNYFEKNLLKLSNPYKFDIYEKYGIPLMLISIPSMAASIYCAARFNMMTAAVVIGSYCLGFVYSTGPVKNLVRKKMPEPLRLVYNSKIVACVGWIIITVLVPMIGTRLIPTAFFSFSAYVFALIFLRTELLDLIAFQGDLILGRETLPVLIGSRAIRRISLIISATALALFGIVTLLFNDPVYLVLTASIIYYVILVYLVQKLNYFISLKYELLVDLNLAFVVLCYFIIRYG